MAAGDTIDFWYLDKLNHQTEWDDGMDWEGVVCAVNPDHQRAGKRITDLHVVVDPHGTSDFSWTSVLSYCIIRDSVLSLLRKKGITGFEAKPVKARHAKSHEPPPVLWELIVTGWAGVAKPESGIRLDESASCRECGYLRYTGMRNPNELIARSQWDGSDFFMLWPMPKYIFVTGRVASLIRDNQLTGARLLPISELKMVDGFSPGRLRYHMPDDRARQLGESIGIY